VTLVIGKLEVALLAVDEHAGSAESFELPIANSLIDPVGMTMTVITDRILRRGWWPDGFVQLEGYRIYKYRSAA
jgi:hypothetical protein